VAIVASSLTSGSSATATTTASFAAQASGTWLVLVVSSDDYRLTSGANRPESTGWTLQVSGQDFLGFYVWTKVSTGAETSVSYTIGSAAPSAYVVGAVTGATGTFDVAPTAAATHTHGGGSASPANAPVPTAGNRLALACFGAMHSSTGITSSSYSNSYAQVAFQAGPATGSQEAVGVASLALSPANGSSSTTSTVTWSGSQLCSFGSVLVFAESGGGGIPGSVTAVRATGTGAALAPFVSAGGVANVSAPVATATAVAQTPAVAGASVVSGGGPATGTAQARAPIVTGAAAVLAVRATGTGAAVPPSVAGGGGSSAVVTAVRATGTALAHSPIVAGLQAATVAALRATAQAMACAPQVEVVAPVFRFKPPTIEIPMPTAIEPLRHYRITKGLSVVRVSGAFQTINTPSDIQLQAAGREGTDYFVGGHEYEISAAVAAELQAAGYTVS